MRMNRVKPVVDLTELVEGFSPGMFDGNRELTKNQSKLKCFLEDMLLHYLSPLVAGHCNYAEKTARFRDFAEINKGRYGAMSAKICDALLGLDESDVSKAVDTFYCSIFGHSYGRHCNPNHSVLRMVRDRSLKIQANLS